MLNYGQNFYCEIFIIISKKKYILLSKKIILFGSHFLAAVLLPE